MFLKVSFLITILWNICSVPEAFGQNYPVRSGRHMKNDNIPNQYTSRLIFNSRVYPDNLETNTRSQPGSYNGHNDQNSGNIILNTPRPVSRSHATVGRNNKHNSTFNFGSWKILNENKERKVQQRPRNKKVSRRKVNNGGNNANVRMIHDSNIGMKDTPHISTNSAVLNNNAYQFVNDGKSKSENENRLTTKLGSNSCACYWKQEMCGCDCEGTLNYDDFQDVSRSFFPCHNFTFTMADGEFYALPPNFFSKIKSVQDFNLFITNSTFEYMCDPTPLTSPFKGVIFENSAQIKLTNVNVRRGWNWKPFDQLKSSSGAQVNVTLENCQLRRLTSDFANLAGGHVDTIDIYNSDLEMVGSNAFGTFENMTRFRIPSNKIRHLRRTDFPQLLFNLEELDLRNNELSYLDNDLFTNMPSLKEIMLSGNPINVLPEATFQAVISKAELVGISDISLTCDCRLQWLKDLVKYDNITEKNMKGAVCKRPPYLRGMPFDFLSKEHLICH